ncbi:MAG: nicotinate (nicotinamide) nucleotide adenylyltransferase [Verrucomicrobia bacterium]|nr:nicotinate (nicotinamide) nucleotide adenylyltransferase [Verrucomicrobiota bacterium]
MMKRIGLYGGTFDPIHFGHLHLALELADRHALDQVLFIPAVISPHKLDSAPTSAHHRVAMVSLAIKDYEKFKLDDREIRRGGASYTIDTVKEIKQEQLGNFFLLLSDEIVPSLPRWKGIEELIAQVPLLVGRRQTPRGQLPLVGHPLIDEAVKKGFTEMPVLEISATLIRERLAQGLPCDHLVPAAVLRYLFAHHIY